jgi:hypothetical protein
VVTLADTLSITFVDQTVEDGGVQHLHHRCAQKVPKEIICVIVSVALNEHAETAAISWCVADRAWFADAPIRSTPFASASAAHSKQQTAIAITMRLKTVRCHRVAVQQSYRRCFSHPLTQPLLRLR